MPDQETTEVEKISRAAAQARSDIARDAANAKDVISQAAATAISTLSTASAVQQRDIEYLKATIARIETKLDAMDVRYVSQSVYVPDQKRMEELESDVKACGKNSVTQKSFDTLQTIVYTLIGTFLVTSVGIIIKLSIK